MEKQHVVEGEEGHEEDLEGVEGEVAFEGPVVEVVVDPLVGEGGEVVLVVAALEGSEEEVDSEQIMLPHCNGTNSSRDGGIVVQQGSLRSVMVNYVFRSPHPYFLLCIGSRKYKSVWTFFSSL